MRAGGRRLAKADLPHKTCPVCARPFTWRKAWARDWDHVIYCSDRCRASKRRVRDGSADDGMITER